MKRFGAYAPCFPSMLLALIPAFIGDVYDNKLCFFFSGICMGIAIHQWMVSYAAYGLRGRP
jgi:hypothetical protein